MMRTPTPKMSLAPVFYTLAQVQFNPIAQMSDYVPRLQEHLRLNGFPDFRAENQIEVMFRRLDETQPDIQPQHHVRWSFTNTQSTEGYLLLSNALVFHTTEYNTFEDFLQKAIAGLSLVDKIVKLAYIERIGLRYLDAVVPAENELLQQYLNPSLLGLSSNIDGTLSHSFTETVIVLKDGTLVTRAVTTDGSLAVSPDLFPLQLKLQTRFAEVNRRNTVLDTDYFVTKRTDFNLTDIETQLLDAHDIITNAFRVSVTDHAREKWA
jgi:uncharacterized protein (TIGR04255 family)